MVYGRAFVALFLLSSLAQAQLETSSRTSSASYSTITPAPLSCTGSSTVHTTTECTYGHTYSFCYAPPPPITCSDGYYPSVYYPGRCITQSTCFPLPTTTTTCEGVGLVPVSTTTLFDGTLSNGASTIIEQPICRCDGHYVWNSNPYASFCLPTGTCATFLEASSTTYSFTSSSSVVTISQTLCNCPANQTPVYTSNTVYACETVVPTSTAPASVSAVSTAAP